MNVSAQRNSLSCQRDLRDERNGDENFISLLLSFLTWYVLLATIRVWRNYLAAQVRLAVVALKARAEYHETEERFNL